MSYFAQILDLKLSVIELAMLVKEVKECRDKQTDRQHWGGHMFSKFPEIFESRDQVDFVIETVEEFIDILDMKEA